MFHNIYVGQISRIPRVVFRCQNIGYSKFCHFQVIRSTTFSATSCLARFLHQFERVLVFVRTFQNDVAVLLNSGVPICPCRNMIRIPTFFLKTSLTIFYDLIFWTWKNCYCYLVAFALKFSKVFGLWICSLTKTDSGN